MSPSLQTVSGLAYLAASLLFILSLRGLSSQDSARRGNLFGTVGMVLAVAVTAFTVLAPLWSNGGVGAAAATAEGPTAGPPASSVALLLVALVAGAGIGAVLAARVAMTSMPELVAILHSFVGAAAVLVGIASYLTGPNAAEGGLAHLIEIDVGVFVGAVTFSGSLVAFGKLRGRIGSKPRALPGRHAANVIMVLICVVSAVVFVRAPSPMGLPALLVTTTIALALGIHLVMAIGGGDMPVVVSLLNSYSGWAASAAGFMLSNDLLIITGALVGSSGAILSIVMCRAMNRSIMNVVFGTFGVPDAPRGAGKGAPAGTVHEATPEQVSELLTAARNVVIVPGYGLAVAQAQYLVHEISSHLERQGVKVRYAIHPVAGRLPGHMNVLLAEANVSYDIVKEMDEINEDFANTDVVLVIGANDIVNPSALDDPQSPIYGMPVLEVWKAGRVVMLKRGLAAGYAGVDNPLVYRDNTLMLFGDAKQSVGHLLAALGTTSHAA
jgi:NAD(P) transhydrogenase subunit beta